MRAFYLAWSGAPKKLTQAVSEPGARRAAEKLPQTGIRRSGSGGPRVAVSAKNATTQREGNVQKMHIALKRQHYGQGVLADRGRQLVQKMHQFRWCVNEKLFPKRK